MSNWFDEADFKTDCYSIRDSFGALTAHPDAGKIVGAFMQKLTANRGDVARSANENPDLRKMMASMSFEALLEKVGDAVSASMVREIPAASSSDNP